jgi:hypothetical protein
MALGRNILPMSARSKRRERWLAEAVEESLTQEERRLLFKAGEFLDRIAAYGSTASDRSPRRTRRIGIGDAGRL